MATFILRILVCNAPALGNFWIMKGISLAVVVVIGRFAGAYCHSYIIRLVLFRDRHAWRRRTTAWYVIEFRYGLRLQKLRCLWWVCRQAIGSVPPSSFRRCHFDLPWLSCFDIAERAGCFLPSPTRWKRALHRVQCREVVVDVVAKPISVCLVMIHVSLMACFGRFGTNKTPHRSGAKFLIHVGLGFQRAFSGDWRLDSRLRLWIYKLCFCHLCIAIEVVTVSHAPPWRLMLHMRTPTPTHTHIYIYMTNIY